MTLKTNYFLNRAFALNFFITPIYIYYLKSYGLSYTEISFLHMIRDVVIFSCEIPFGIVSDWMGRKVMIYLSGVLAICSLLSFVIMPIFSFFALSFALWGAAIAADSGTVSALIYESIENKEEHKKLVSTSEVFRKIMHSIVNFLGSFLYLIHATLPFLASIILMFIPMITGSKLPKSNHKRLSKQKYFNKIKAVFSNSATVIKMLSVSLMVSSFSLTFMYQQPRLEAIGLDVRYFGIVFGGLLLIGTIGSYFLRHFDLNKSMNQSFMILNVLMAIGIFFMAVTNNGMITIGSMILLALLNGLVYPLKFVIINDLIDNDIRSGVLSVQSYLEFLSKSVISLGIGVVADLFTLEVAIKMIAIIPFSLACLFILFNNPSQNKSS